MIRDSNASSASTFSDLRGQALRGAAAGLTYGVIERLFASVIPWVLKPAYVYQPPNRVAVVALLVLYAAAGAAFQTLVAAVAGRSRSRIADAAVRLAVIAIFVFNFAVEYLPPFLLANRKLYAAALVAQAVALVLLVAVEFVPAFGSRRLLTVTSISFLLLLPWYLIIDVFAERRVVFKAAVAAASIAAIFLLAWLAPRVLSRRELRIAAAFLALLIAGIALFAPQKVDAAAAPRLSRQVANFPNIVLITLDTVRADHLSLYGYRRETTPALSRFAREATLYTNAFSSGDMTLSSHASLFTGLEPRSHGAHFTPDFQFGRPLGPGVPTLSEMLASRGYDTIGVVANSGFLGHAFGLNRGFRYYDQRVDTPLFAQMSEYFIGRGVADAARRIFARDARFVSGRTAEAINRDVLAAMQGRGGRFFLFINYLDAHWPYFSPPPFSTMFPGAADDAMPDDYLRHALAKDASPQYCGILMARYDGAIRYLDQQIGELLALLQQRGLYDDALIIITSDHGEAFGERGQLSHGMSVYANQIDVPLIVKRPHQRRAEIVAAPISSVGVFDMIAAAAGVRRDSPSRGDSVMAEHFGIANDGQVAITDGRMKLVRNADGTAALYDLQRDRLEQHDVMRQPEYSAARAVLAALLDARIAVADRERQRLVTSSNIDESYLRSLGYLR